MPVAKVESLEFSFNTNQARLPGINAFVGAHDVPEAGTFRTLVCRVVLVTTFLNAY